VTEVKSFVNASLQSELGIRFALNLLQNSLLRLHLTLNPSPKGEGFSSISLEMVAFDYRNCRLKECAACDSPFRKKQAEALQ